jgi:hypothetical protein
LRNTEHYFFSIDYLSGWVGASSEKNIHTSSSRDYYWPPSQGVMAMQMSDTVEVVQVAGAQNANAKLGEGWKLLAVVPGTAPASGASIVVYVLGKPGSKPVAEMSEPEVPDSAQRRAGAKARAKEALEGTE